MNGYRDPFSWSYLSFDTSQDDVAYRPQLRLWEVGSAREAVSPVIRVIRDV